MLQRYHTYKVNEATGHKTHAFEQMFLEPSRMFYADILDQLTRYADSILKESPYKHINYPQGYYVIFMYQGEKFKMTMSTSGMSAYCYHLVQDKEIHIGSMSQSISIMFEKIDKYLKKLKK